MLKTVFLSLCLFVSFKLSAQPENILLNAEHYTLLEMEGMAEHLGLKNQKLAFGYNTGEDTLVIASLREKNTVVLGHVINEYFFNSAKMYDLHWSNDTVYIGSEMPFRATYWTFHFIWNKKTEAFFASEPDYFDPSSEALEKADSLLAAGDVRKAIENYYGIMYPSVYMNEAATGVQIMEKSHEKALIFYKEKEYDSAVAYMELGLGFYPNSNYLAAKTKEEFDSNKQEYAYNMVWKENQEKLWLGDYGLFLYRNKQYEKSIEINKYITMILPDLAGPYLQLADSYFDSDDKGNAKIAYKKYMELKKSEKKENEIPKRVKERIK